MCLYWWIFLKQYKLMSAMCLPMHKMCYIFNNMHSLLSYSSIISFLKFLLLPNRHNLKWHKMPILPSNMPNMHKLSFILYIMHPIPKPSTHPSRQSFNLITLYMYNRISWWKQYTKHMHNLPILMCNMFKSIKLFNLQR